jgi:hypothetical protein
MPEFQFVNLLAKPALRMGLFEAIPSAVQGVAHPRELNPTYVYVRLATPQERKHALVLKARPKAICLAYTINSIFPAASCWHGPPCMWNNMEESHNLTAGCLISH